MVREEKHYTMIIRHLIWRNGIQTTTRRITTAATNGKNELSHFLAETIKATGPIKLSTYMRQCLTNPNHGYYINHDPFGKMGDFTTSPEISQMFGELVGIWLYTQWIGQGRPKKIKLVELGPGRGTLMSDILRTLKKFPVYKSIDSVQLIEASPLLKEKQKQLLSSSGNDKQIHWFDNLKQVVVQDDVKPFILAHEFFDALPILQFEKTADGWRERRVDYSIINGDKNPTFHLAISPHATPSSLVVPMSHNRYRHLSVGSIIEICPQAWEITQYMSRLISNGGCGLIIDYGPSDTIPINTLRGIRNHKLVNPFDNPGFADLSCDVDFDAIKTVAIEYGIDSYGPIEQSDWLHQLGIGNRASILSRQNPNSLNQIKSAYHRLTDKSPGAMGKVYKILALEPKSSTKPVGFGGSVLVD